MNTDMINDINDALLTTNSNVSGIVEILLPIASHFTNNYNNFAITNISGINISGQTISGGYIYGTSISGTSLYINGVNITGNGNVNGNNLSMILLYILCGLIVIAIIYKKK